MGRQNGQTLALPLSSPNTPPSHPSPPMHVMPSGRLLACRTPFIIVPVRAVVGCSESPHGPSRTGPSRSRTGSPGASPQVSTISALNQPRLFLSVLLSYKCTHYYPCFQLRKLFNRYMSNAPNGRRLCWSVPMKGIVVSARYLLVVSDLQGLNPTPRNCPACWDRAELLVCPRKLMGRMGGIKEIG